MRTERRSAGWRSVAAGASFLLLALAAAPSAASASSTAAPVAEQYSFERLAKAQPDECFAGVGQPYPAGPPCATGKAKVNQAYVWGLTRTGSQVWFGTGANTFCLTSGADLAVTVPLINNDFVCEYGESQVVKNHPAVPGAVGDVRPPQVWIYDASTKTVQNKTSEISTASAADARRLRTTLGIRSAGNLNGVVLFAGPSLTGTLNLFAFDAASKRFLGSRTISRYGNARTFLAAAGDLYLGVGTGPGGRTGGAILRWTGNRLTPFTFAPVGTLPAQVADLAYHDGKLVATTWVSNKPTTAGQLAGLWISPQLPLTRTSTWTQVFNAGQYETDPLITTTYGLGGVASYGGYVYWGTMHVPLESTKVHQDAYPQSTDQAKKQQIQASQRGTSIWRGKDLGTPNQKIELLYGESNLPVFDPSTNTWSSAPTGWTPLYGHSGLNNRFNNYTWRMAVAGDRLYVATMDWSYLVHDLTTPPPPTDPAGWGGDLWVFPSTTQPAEPISTTGVGNYLNYGIRNMNVDGNDLYLGMANPMNLRTNPTDEFPEGGWELIKLTRNPG